ncbi:polysaccharide lyase family protein [Streptomyces sp. NPDC048415]|uniref:polysaccharide lyase family protein n=1 Tax=Streptomyces sp. NPDC048415 TaxID=3154822 RepID=UPI00344751C7
MSTHGKRLTRRRVPGASRRTTAGRDWESAVPSAPTRPATRPLTADSYRGNNHTFVFHVPSSAWKTDTSQYNGLKLNSVSGATGSARLSPGTSFDCIDLLA